MCYAPHVQRKAQAEIDVFSETKERWPNLQERDQFPYLRALIKEIYRWGVVAPLGIPHRLTEDLPYDDYVIPRDTTLLPNSWYAFVENPWMFQTINELDFASGLFVTMRPSTRTHTSLNLNGS